MEQFQPNANNILDVLYNKKPKYLPLYEHHIDIEFIEKFTGEELIGYRETEPEYFFKKVTEFWKNNTYDAFDFKASRNALPNSDLSKASLPSTWRRLSPPPHSNPIRF